jgi:S-DNA-T family DNA segregation ATPase FtsK/SpoIIIE
MPASLVVWILSALLLVGVMTQRWWEPRLEARGFPVRRWPWRWWLVGYPATAWRIVSTWRRLAYLNGLSVSTTSDRRVIGRDLVVQGQALRPKPPRLSWPVPTATGVTVRVLLHPGQTPAPYFQAARAMEHAWRVHGVRVASQGMSLRSVRRLMPCWLRTWAESRTANPG